MKINTALFVELINNFFWRVGSGAAAEDVSGGSVSYVLGGMSINHPVHVQISLGDHCFYVSFASDTPFSIDKRLFNTETEASRKQLIRDIEKICAWQLDLLSAGVEFTLTFGGAKARAGGFKSPALVRTKPPVLTAKPVPKSTLPAPVKGGSTVNVPLALQRPKKVS